MTSQAVSVVIRDDGDLVCLNNEAAACFTELGSVTTRRASHVEPEERPLRFLFHVLRYIFGDKGRMSEFTRHWPCTWRVNLTPVGGPVMSHRWQLRQDAIDAEVEWLNDHLT